MTEVKADIWGKPLYKENFTFSTVPVTDYFRSGSSSGNDVALALYLRYFVSPADLESSLELTQTTGLETQLLQAMAKRALDKKLDIHVSGSASEKLQVPDFRQRESSNSAHAQPDMEYISADNDIMFLMRQYPVWEADFSSSSGSFSAFRLDYSGCPSGFGRIKVQRDWAADEDSDALWRPGFVEKDGQLWLSGLRLVELLEAQKPDSLEAMVRQGPALTSDVPLHKGLGWVMSLSTDAVMALRCPQWISQAKEWTTRPRTSGWLSDGVMEAIVRRGCHVVPIGHHQSAPADRDLEWRLSFSAAEKALSAELTSSQRRCYIIFKFLCKVHLSIPRVLATYHLKTTFFWVCDQVPAARWREVNTVDMVRLLLQKLIHFLAEGFLPNYFIRANNMIGHVCPEAVKTTLRKALAIHQGLLAAVMEADRRMRFDIGSTLPLCAIFLPLLKFQFVSGDVADGDAAGKSFRVNAIASLIQLGLVSIEEGNMYYFKALAAFKDAWALLGMEEEAEEEGEASPRRGITHDPFVFASVCSLRASPGRASEFHDWLVVAESKAPRDEGQTAKPPPSADLGGMVAGMGLSPTQTLLYYHQARLATVAKDRAAATAAAAAAAADPSAGAAPGAAAGAAAGTAGGTGAPKDVFQQLTEACVLMHASTGVLDLDTFLRPHLGLAHWYYTNGKYRETVMFMTIVNFVMGRVASRSTWSPDPIRDSCILPDFITDILGDLADGDVFTVRANLYFQCLQIAAFRSQDKSSVEYIPLEQEGRMLDLTWRCLDSEEDGWIAECTTRLLSRIAAM